MRFIRLLIGLLVLSIAGTAFSVEPGQKLPIAALLASWFPNSHPDVLIGRVLRTYSEDGKGTPSQLQIVSAYVDRPQKTDFSEKLAAEVISLPMHPYLDEPMQGRIIDSVRRALKQ